MMTNNRKREKDRAEHMLAIADRVEAAVEKKVPADQELARIFRRNRRYGSHDRRFYANAVFSIFRWKGWLGNLRQNGPRVALYSLLLEADTLNPRLEALAEIAGVDPGSIQPLGNLELLEEKARALADIGACSEPPDCEDLAPEWVWDHLPFKDGQLYRSWVGSLQQALPVWLRFFSEKEDKALKLLRDNGIDPRQHPAVTAAWQVEKNISREILNRKEANCIQIQDLASQCVGLACEAKSGEDWWDVCAGAGGKTLQLADLMGNSGMVIASDARSRALRNLNMRLRNSNVDIVKTRKMEVEDATPELGVFDGVLIDAPCSGSGTWGRNPDARWRTEPEFVQRCAESQLKILRNTAESVKPGGKLVFAVCSLFREETIDIVERFLDERGDFKLDSFADPLTGEETDGLLFIEPWQEPTIGMFIARFSTWNDKH